MFNKEVSPEIEKKQAEMFEMLIDIFTAGAEIKTIDCKSGAYKWQRTKNDNYTVTSMLNRQECTVKEGKKVVFEIYLGSDYVVATRGKYLKHLRLEDELLEKIRSALTYHENYDMKHLFSIDKKDVPIVCKAYIVRDENYDNGLIKEGEIEGSQRPQKG